MVFPARAAFVGVGALWLTVGSDIARAGEADVTAVEVEQTSPGVYAFRVTVGHEDSGWDHFADAWAVVAPDGTVLATRVLLHPHVDEQPFTRALDGVAIPEEIAEVIVRAHDSVHGLGGRAITIELPR